ncbi:MAG TPA: 1-(5-phosphoribosyl)-5-amino-4-imidazole-carboxylate carboxylase, partial [Kofleriaceae bacterium]|nr:1-(5-phosphoribosyl)-5-amino-4-imidazole-carboxylate carboxylase [Kofleriaceae bacterium]
MDRTKLLDVLDAVRAGTLSPGEAAKQLDGHSYAELVIDHTRERRTGVPEIVFGATKSAAQIAAAMRELAEDGAAIATRVDAAKAEEVRRLVPGVVAHELARVLTLGSAARPACAPIAVVCAGTSDLPVAEEASIVAEFLGAPVVRIADVGVAGLHRLLARLD